MIILKHRSRKVARRGCDARLVAATDRIGQRFLERPFRPLPKHVALRTQPLRWLLKSAGYQPCRLRPYRHLETVLVAGIWKKGLPEGPWEADLTLEQLARSDEKAGREGAVLVDIAGYRAAAGDRYLAVWSKTGQRLENQFYAGVKDDGHDAAWFKLKAEGDFPLVLNGFHSTQAGMHNSGVWARRGRCTGVCLDWGNRESMAEKSRLLAAKFCQMDAGFCYGTGKRGGERYAAVWHERSDTVAVTVEGDPGELLRRGRGLASDGYAPAAISMASPDGEDSTYGVCVWHRSIPVGELLASATTHRSR